MSSVHIVIVALACLLVGGTLAVLDADPAYVSMLLVAGTASLAAAQQQAHTKATDAEKKAQEAGERAERAEQKATAVMDAMIEKEGEL